MVKTRTDGKRLLVYTDSGNVKKEKMRGSLCLSVGRGGFAAARIGACGLGATIAVQVKRLMRNPLS